VGGIWLFSVMYFAFCLSNKGVVHSYFFFDSFPRLLHSYLGEGSYGVVIATEDTTDKDNKVRVYVFRVG